MEIIKNYLDNVFQSLPQTQEILNLKDELLANMGDKYEELKASGKTENEAIGIVISEFGNIDELLKEMNINVSSESQLSLNKPVGPTLSLEDARNFISLKRKSARFVGLGVALILLGVATLIGCIALIDADIILKQANSNSKGMFPVIMLFLFIVPAVGLFIFSGTQLELFKFIEEGKFELSNSAKAILSKEYPSVNAQKPLAIITGVSLCILSPVPIFIGSMFSDNLTLAGVCVLLVMIALAVNIFIYTGMVPEAYKRLLKLEEFSPEKKQEDKLIGAVAGIVWPLATAVFLFLGFVFNLWGICWLVFPITGMLFGGFCAFYSALHSK
ncbi:permease prefix domain 1-containing protein [Cellulosilyticum sp. ST5]|uniref:permease prefix domain 1-containing protein n=1 Tax=Cellulosilyticum sp. ST5 TaxID=3055805 RepID=UPI0039777B97